MNSVDLNLEDRTERTLADRFESFARVECGTTDSGLTVGSPTYALLSRHIAKTSWLLEIAGQCMVSQPIPNLLFASIKYLAEKQSMCALACAYRDVESGLDAPRDLVGMFESFCRENFDAIVGLVQSRRVQTNEIGRCTALMPIFASVAKDAGQKLSLVDVGAGAGLNLLWDQYAYEYSDGSSYGRGIGQVKLSCELRGRLPPIDNQYCEVGYRIGVDLNPIDLSDEEDLKWLLALIWPEHAKRRVQLEAAREVWLENRPQVVKGDAIEVLPSLIAKTPLDSAVCVYHCHVFNQLALESRTSFISCLETISRDRVVYEAALEEGEFSVDRFQNGTSTRLFQGSRSAHGHWLQWST